MSTTEDTEGAISRYVDQIITRITQNLAKELGVENTAEFQAAVLRAAQKPADSIGMPLQNRLTEGFYWKEGAVHGCPADGLTP